ncbi:MAG TPA: hypothetical protein VFA38_11365 [Nitrospirales bacterium]|nr:hypothetical protein [Nitrospirales bacterium]
MKRLSLLVLVLLAGCASNQWQAAHEECKGNPHCQDLIEAKQAALETPPPPAPASHDPIVAPVMPLPRQPNTCVGRTDDSFLTTRCY